MEDDTTSNRAWALMVAMSVFAATAVMAQQPSQLPEQVAVCAAVHMVQGTDDGAH